MLLDQGRSKLAQGALDDAVDAFTACLAVDGRNAGALQGRAIARFQMKDWPAAEKDFTAAKTAQPDDPENWNGVALCRAMQNDVYPALALFDEILARWPGFVQARIHLGLLNLKIGAVAKGRDHLKDALNRRPTLDQRRLIEKTLKEQEKLDAGRYYRPDFVRLNADAQGSALLGRLAAWVKNLFPSSKENPPSKDTPQ
jgi:tetratricopeptide (TPR) repeat protein